MSEHSAPYTFMAESRELLREMEQALLQLEKRPDDVEAVNAVFRAMHTIKGSAGVFGFDAICGFAHVVEELMGDVRSGSIPVTEALVGLLLRCADHALLLIDCLAGDDRLEALQRNAPAGDALAGEIEAWLAQASGGAAVQPVPAAGAWQVTARFAPEVLRQGMDPLSIIRYLCTLGPVQHGEVLVDSLPEPQAMDPQSCYLGFRLQMPASVERSLIEGAFEYVRGASDVTIRTTGRDEDAAAGAAGGPRESPTEATGAGTDARFVRVQADKLDELINLVGELVIASAGVSTIARRGRVAEMQESAATLDRMVEEVRERALKLRMVPIGETFTRFQRVVHDLGRELRKDVELVVSGGETELDKSMVEKLRDPLLHLVRNSLDHGIEPPQVRAARGKTACGRLRLNAYHEAGSIVIEVEDDGAGLDRQKILRRAQQHGMVQDGQVLSDKEVFRLVMEPGFSTADRVTSVSGRGVGMDVVRRNVEALRGSIAIDSAPGEGTHVAIRLPLTLAIIEGFVVGVGPSAYVIPLEAVVECMELSGEQRERLGESGFINLRGDVLPLLRLRDVFEAGTERGKRENIVIVQYEGRQAGFVVDALMGEFQTVVKPLGKLFERLSGIGGATIFGNGEVALILDVQALVGRAIGREAGSVRRRQVDRRTPEPMITI